MPEDQNKETVTLDSNSEEFKTAVAQAVETATAGLKSNRDDILREKAELKKQHEDLTKKVESLGDLDSLQSIVKQFSEDSEAKLIAEGKIDEVLAKRTEAMRLDSQSQVEAITAKNTELEENLGAARQEITILKVGSQLDMAAATLECASTAMNDIRRAGLDVFTINPETNQIEARDANGAIILGPDAKSPLTPANWLEQQKKNSPHWWGPSVGGGAGGGRRGDPSTDPKQLEKMSARELLVRGIGK